MRLLSRVAFYRRLNDDETWDSVCLKCFLTVPTVAQEDDLEDAERHHDCEELTAFETLF